MKWQYGTGMGKSRNDNYPYTILLYKKVKRQTSSIGYKY